MLCQSSHDKQPRHVNLVPGVGPPSPVEYGRAINLATMQYSQKKRHVLRTKERMLLAIGMMGRKSRPGSSL